MRGRYQEAVDTFHWSVETLRTSTREPEEGRQRMLAACLSFEGHCAFALAQENASDLAHESISILRGLPASGRETVYALALLHDITHDGAEKLQLAQEALQIAKASGAGWWIPVFIIDWSNLAMKQGRYAEAKALAQEALAINRKQNNQAHHAAALMALSRIAELQGDYAEARQLAEEALSISEAAGYLSGAWWMHSTIADGFLMQGDYATAQTHYKAGLALCRELDNRRGSVFELSGLGSAVCGLGDHQEAQHYFYEALQQAKAINHLSATLDVFGAIAWLVADIGQSERALQLAAYVLDQPATEPVATVRATQLLQRLERTLPPDTFTAAIAQGKSLDLDETLNVLLAELSQPQHAPTAAQLLADPLTERELEVLRYIAEGLSNYEIAMRLFVGVSTVKTHINHIYSKLNVKSRTQAIAQARELRLI